MQSVNDKEEEDDADAAMQFELEETDGMQSVQEDCDAWSVEAEAGGMQALEKGADQEIKSDKEGAPSKQPGDEVKDEEHIPIKCREEVVAVPEPKIHLIDNLEFREYFAALESCPVTKLQIFLESKAKGPHLVLRIRSQRAEEIEVTIFATASLSIYVAVDGRTLGDLYKLSYWLQSSGAVFPLEVAVFDAMEVRGFLDRVRGRHMWAARVQLQLRRQDSVITIGDFVSSTAHESQVAWRVCSEIALCTHDYEQG
ncbi:hypothetical protein AXG93_4859s1040 [Marchantia polymorpha subsp. ruderalis]|uniref:Uncharacterized protein n=1 Tax=Marchantia polymorpha subsp. ruderalis TaxID=1480154 RepID=A0A176WBZ2_MARPO|nr:hypothetical protein AXG93_4859s1040 [Marchantia polymorpha subsp. ruderalis]